MVNCIEHQQYESGCIACYRARRERTEAAAAQERFTKRQKDEGKNFRGFMREAIRLSR
jgi:hypothetical protein